MAKISELADGGAVLADDEILVLRAGGNVRATMGSGITSQPGGDVDVNGKKFTNFESTGIDDNATSTAITIDSNENVLVGKSSSYGVGETSTLQVKNGVVFGQDNTGDASNRNWGIFANSSGAGNLDFVDSSSNTGWPNNAYRMTIDKAGNVGIGTDDPAPFAGNGTTLHLSGVSTTSELRVTRGNGSDLSLIAGSSASKLQTNDATRLVFATDNTDRMTIDASGTTTVTGGFHAAQPGAGANAFAAGPSAGETTQGTYSVAVGSSAGRLTQGGFSVAVGPSAGYDTQGASSVAIGNEAGKTTQGAYSTAIGPNAGKATQGGSAVAVGSSAGNTGQGNNSVAVGVVAGQTSQGFAAVGIGSSAGKTTQGENAVAVGRDAGETSQGQWAAALGYTSGQIRQGDYSTALGYASGQTDQGISAVAVGNSAGNDTQGAFGTAVGYKAGFESQGTNSVAMGRGAGLTTQGASSVAVGYAAGETGQSDSSVAIGSVAGKTSQGLASVAVGSGAGNSNQGSNTTAVGYGAGKTSQGNYSVALGYAAGEANQAANGIIINSSGVARNSNIPGHIDLNSSEGSLKLNPVASTWTFAGGDVTVPNDSFLVGVTSAGWGFSGSVNAKGYAARSGQNGSFSGNGFNINWTGSPFLYIDSTNVGQISTVSDYRVKTNIETQTQEALSRISQLRPVTYQRTNYKKLFKAENEVLEGFIAHELQEIVPSAVAGEKDDPDQVQSLKLDALCSVMVKAIQEQQAMIETLQAEVAALKGA